MVVPWSGLGTQITWMENNLVWLKITILLKFILLFLIIITKAAKGRH